MIILLILVSISFVASMLLMLFVIDNSDELSDLHGLEDEDIEFVQHIKESNIFVFLFYCYVMSLFLPFAIVKMIYDHFSYKE